MCASRTHIIHGSACTRTHTYMNTRRYNKEWWRFKLVGGLHNKAKPSAASLRTHSPTEEDKGGGHKPDHLSYTNSSHMDRKCMQLLNIKHEIVSHGYHYYKRCVCSGMQRRGRAENTARSVLTPSLPIVAKCVIPVLLHYIVPLIVVVHWEMGPGGTLRCVT